MSFFYFQIAIQDATLRFVAASPGGFPGSSGGKESACNAGDLGLIPGLEEPLEKGMATHSRIFAWRIPWTEEPAGLQSVGSQRVGCNFIHLIQL